MSMCNIFGEILLSMTQSSDHLPKFVSVFSKDISDEKLYKACQMFLYSHYAKNENRRIDFKHSCELFKYQQDKGVTADIYICGRHEIKVDEYEYDGELVIKFTTQIEENDDLRTICFILIKPKNEIRAIIQDLQYVPFYYVKPSSKKGSRIVINFIKKFIKKNKIRFGIDKISFIKKYR
jgi:hypothetical protein